MDIVGKARKLESKIARTLDDAVKELVGRTARQPLETVHAIVEAVAAQVQPAGRDRHTFPFNVVTVTVVAASREARLRFAAVADGPPSLADRVLERLRTAGCRGRDIDVKVSYVPRARSTWSSQEFHVAFDRVDRAPARVDPVAPAAPPRLELTIVAGTAERRSYVLAEDRIDIGRRAEVVDSRQRLLRTNHIAFAEGGEYNQTVSRRHAHIVFNRDLVEYRLFDDGSAHGTSVIRNGRTIPVPAGSRGTRLHAGDEIVLGRARLRVKM